jgi:hypothetical protein
MVGVEGRWIIVARGVRMEEAQGLALDSRLVHELCLRAIVALDGDQQKRSGRRRVTLHRMGGRSTCRLRLVSNEGIIILHSP